MRQLKQAIRRAFRTASMPQPVGEPLDWMDTTRPRWRLDGKVAAYDWYGPEGATPFPR